ncbi:AAA family ATPase [Limibaculum sp. FT325]|uniref:bifunctional aminoglycoside phosphotransferase/ATP-binding protein n=1 Tax=Thermohalobaculum sediminis TaxID=2939436 RepID=UPI0020C09DBC|nr:bifunctional aminoglycoside phosphotransferase/ATP-binding protein [Limibaculum sediminis]MCL5777254.1 AAA family ATPase [Limibaculum sediminis]
MAGEGDSAEFERFAAFLADPATHGGTRPERIDTHTAAVFLAGERAFKLRRPVDYGFLDYSTRARRRASALREIAENSRTAPGLYLGLAGIGDAPPRLIPPPAPESAEPVVLMRRFDAAGLFDRMAAQGRLDAGLMHATGKAVADMHRSAPARPCLRPLPELALAEVSAIDRLASVIGDAAAPVARLLREHGRRLAPAAAARPARRCHGDLHLRNIVLWQGRPAPFDCIDFNDELTDIDPLYDLAFLMMDLDHRGRRDLASVTFNAWAERMAADGEGEQVAYGGLGLLPLYRACRAAIRAKVAGLTVETCGGEGAADEARAYAELARGYLEAPRRPRLIAVGGLSGSGKSTLARALAGPLDAVVLRSDAIRKAMWGAEEAERLPKDAYAPEVSTEVYATMARRARMALAGGATVILDAAHLREAEREAVAALAAEAGAAFTGLWLDAPKATLTARVEARAGDVSDADARVVAMQAGYDLGKICWTRLGADDGPARVAETARTAISRND